MIMNYREGWRKGGRVGEKEGGERVREHHTKDTVPVHHYCTSYIYFTPETRDKTFPPFKECSYSTQVE